jgi:hypothetical protein
VTIRLIAIEVVLDYLMLSADAIVDLHDRSTRAWHQAPSTANEGTAPDEDPPGAWLQAVARQHRANFDLWHIEDEARTPGATDADLARVKRNIDRTNQLRNDLAEALDGALIGWLEPRQLPDVNAPLNSESPGLIIDRLSILALKIYHTREETERTDAEPGHAERNLKRLAILESQRTDLARCLDELWRETLTGTRQFKLYRQLKMYNDPSLNPAVYRNVIGRSPGQSSR